MDKSARFVLTVANATCNDLRVLVCTTEVRFRRPALDSLEDTAQNRYESNNQGVFDESLVDTVDVGQQIVPPSSTGQFFSTAKGIVYLTIHEMGSKRGGYYVVADNTQWISDGSAIVANRRLIASKSKDQCWVDENGQDWIVEQTPRWLQTTDEGILQTVLEHLKFFKDPRGKHRLLQRLTDNENLSFLQNHSALKWIALEAMENLNKDNTSCDESDKGMVMKKLEIKLGDLHRKMMDDVKCLKSQKARMEKWIKSLSDKFKNHDAREKQKAFIDAAKKGSLEEILALLEVGVFVNGIDSFGATALHWACFYGHLEISQVLLDANIDASTQLVRNLEIEGYTKVVSAASTALHVAAFRGHACIVKRLLDFGSDANHLDACGRLSLHLAAFEGHRDCVQILLKHTSDPDFKDSNYGSTPLHLASWKGHLSTVETLVKAGANVAASDYTGWTPLRWATSNGYNTIQQVLASHGASE